ncbi:cytochrome P450 [Paeniglutamicibacter antarcticus]|uniref:Cytochrome P450 n=1 Tax=Paeniglutamicibacter antarcticus TaxID=494023 RepID=A0ABP9TRV5_9MICC
MSCPFSTTPTLDRLEAPLGIPLERAYPAAINQRYRSIEDPKVVREILRRVEDFSPANALSTAIDLTPAALRILASVKFALPPVLASASGPAHRTVRRIVTGFFTPAKVAAQDGFIRARVKEICGTLQHEYRRGAGVDLAVGLAAVLPPEIMHRLIGIPVPEPSLLKRWSQDSLELFWGWPTEERQLELATSAAEFYAWLRDSVEQGIGRDDGNLYAALHNAGVESGRIRSLGYFLAIAGQETTSMLIQTTLFNALDQGLWPACTDPETGEEKAKEIVSGVLARASSVPTWRRIATADTDIDGESFMKGEQLVLRLSGGALGEAGDDSLAFGFGIHRCLGAGLARLETELVLFEAARALPEIELQPGHRDWIHLLSFQAPTTVPTNAHAGAQTADAASATERNAS